jgi:Na+/melibiose symporter-like transporter
MSTTVTKLSFREKAGYSLGDSSANFVFQTMLIFQTIFYTDVFGIGPAAAGTLFLVVRVMDAFFDPTMGIIADRTKTRWGKFRPWIVWTALPFGLLFWLAFTTPDFGATGKLVYAYVTYALLMIIYSANNVPYSALNGVMTGDVNERTSLSSFRFVAAMATAFVVQGLTLPLVDKFGHGNKQLGWSVTIGIFSVIAVVFFVIAFVSARERILPDPSQKSSVRQDSRDLLKNKPWLALFILTVFIFMTLSLRGGSMYYYFSYYVDQGSLLHFLDQVGLVRAAGGEATWLQSVLNAFGLIIAEDRSNVTSVGFSLFNMTGSFVTIVGVLFSKPLSTRFGKKAVFLVCLFLTTLVTASLFFMPANAIGGMFLISILWAAAYGPTIPLLWAMIADAADYSEWKTGRRATGFVYAGIVFALKAALGLGGAVGGWLLSGYGYVANVPQTPHALLGIQLSASLYSALPLLLGVICLIAYPIGKELNLRIGDELAERRKGYAAA